MGILSKEKTEKLIEVHCKQCGNQFDAPNGSLCAFKKLCNRCANVVTKWTLS